MPSPRGEPASGMADLVHDLRHVEVALEAQLARGAERAADGTAGLAADAERVPLASLAPGRIVHEHALDEAPVRQPVEGFSVASSSARRSSVSATVSKRRRSARRVRSGRASVVTGPTTPRPSARRHRSPAGPERRLPHRGKELGELRRLDAGDARARIAAAGGTGGPDGGTEGSVIEARLSTRVPASPGRPRRSAPPSIARPPAGCTSSS